MHPFSLPSTCLSWLAPEILLTVWAMVLLLVEAFTSVTVRQLTWLALAGIAVTFLETLFIDSNTTFFWGVLCKWDGAAKFFHLFFLVVAALVIWMGEETQEPMSHGRGEFVVLPLFTTTGLMLLASVNDFMLLFVALELVTISFYILVAYQRRSVIALEAGVKYLIMGGLSSAFLVMGVAYIFGFSGSTRFDLITPFVHGGIPLGIGFGLLLVLAGIGFKIAMVPFHIWAPDVYEGAPSSITAFLSVGSKAGGLIILLRVLLSVFGTNSAAGVWFPALYACAVLSLLLGNLAAIPQHNLKRLMGYSSIGHTGFILVAVIGSARFLPGLSQPAMSDVAAGQATVMVYLVTYLLATFATFIVLAVLDRSLPGLEIHHLAGLSQRSPLLAAAFGLSLVSLAGVPPLSGFIAKWMVIWVAWNRHLYPLLIVTVFAAVAALYYYLGPLKAMYWSEPMDETPIRLSRQTSVVLIALIVLLLVSGVWAQSISVLVAGATISSDQPSSLLFTSP